MSSNSLYYKGLEMSLQLRRYTPLFEEVIASYPAPVTFHHGQLAVSTHLVRIRALRNFLLERPEHLPPSLPQEKFIACLAHAQITAAGDYITIGDRAAETVPETFTIASAESRFSTNLDGAQLSSDDLRALFYCVERKLLPKPVRVHNIPADTLPTLHSFAASCPSVMMDLSGDSTTAILF